MKITMEKTFKASILMLLALVISGCETAYYNAWEKVGVHKRDILADKIEDTRDAQENAKEEFKDALEQYKAVVAYDGGNLEKLYKKLNAEYEDSVEASAAISQHIGEVENVAEDLFDEWADELDQYSNARLRESSARQLHDTKAQYQRLLRSMKKAEASVQPVLTTLHDQVLYLKHNLNARAVTALRGELNTVNADVNTLISRMQVSIDQANAFIRQIKEN